VEVSARRSAALPCRPVCADCSYSRSSSDTFCGVWGSRDTLDQDIDRPTQFSMPMAPEPGTDYRQPSDCQNCRYLHSSASSRPTSSSTSVLVAAVPRIYRRPATVVSSAPIINVKTQLNSAQLSCMLLIHYSSAAQPCVQCKCGVSYVK